MYRTLLFEYGTELPFWCLREAKYRRKAALKFFLSPIYKGLEFLISLRNFSQFRGTPRDSEGYRICRLMIMVFRNLLTALLLSDVMMDI